ncbi:MAG TPA: S41 family peptidase, partial [Thermoanaerobaculia bacterium]|nr:S41 family peptidase [Thermoanaerobaculia bacterium]
GGGYRFRPVWSPDSKRIAFFDQSMTTYVVDIESGAVDKVDSDPWAEQPELAWSADSSWLAYTRMGDERVGAIWRYDVATRARTRITSNAYHASTPAFDRGGKSLFFLSYRNFNNSVYDWLAQRLVHRATGVLMAVPIRATTSAEEVERNAMRFATTTGAFTAIAATANGDVIYGLTETNGARSVRRYNVAANKEETLDNTTGDFDLAADGRHLLIEREGKLLVRDLTGGDAESELRAEPMKVTIDLRAEWRELFTDAWRIVRDFFYAPKTEKTFDWNDVRARYSALLDAMSSRNDLNWILAEMLGEVGTGHAYMGAPGDIVREQNEPIGMLGADFTIENGAVRISRIYEGAPWDDTARSPLRGIHEGEFLFAVNGVALDASRDPRAAFVGLAGKSVTLRVGATRETARDVVVTPLASDNALRHAAWIEMNRAAIDKISDGRVGYVRIPDFGTNGYNEFARQFHTQIEKKALVFDPRWSQGGWIGAAVAEMLARPVLNSAAMRYSAHAWPAIRYGMHQGPKAVVLNHLVVSAGENFSYYFRRLGLGPLVGSRTWGGMTGLNPVPSLIDGGSLNVPNAPFFDDSGWIGEGRGIEPDVVIEDDPARRGPMDLDPQLDAAVRALMSKLKE